ncbi:GH32 C-terminal domain-containing protein [Arthrobacter sp. EH-1B-1]|uniref:GH32 C-terminal domain-containing protein n=1 Tax=Arthrobacter vasquezii TaxID=2977629 RepID=A0ABT6CUL9_9MICC|nr:GH32 C-terminal domain-containing protein [Arthrobacter vasquezii]MDF9277719.1 GH32 C-terminal domain-containing protein [Arthrobacter vasquezii]
MGTYTPKPRVLALGLAGALVASMAAVGSIPASAEETAVDPATQQYRPYLHYTPEKNWMNDPNGMVYHKGVYHLFYQHNPVGTTWGNMSWGHATSKDLLTWEEQPLAIPQTFNADGVAIEDIFSGSVVVDQDNSSGFGTAENPPLVAIYTSAYTGAHPTHAGKQAQSLAYSTDDGQTWTKYEGNPVLDRDSANFRDPKVFRYDGPAGSYWVMTAVEATDHKVVLYKSDNLKDWTHLSDFGPANSVAGIWECPDLFPIAVDGDPNNVKWVMVVNLNPGAVAGGSGGQYFVGDFDGTTFTSDTTDPLDTMPEGTVFAGFNDGTYNGWTVNNEPGNWKNGPWGDAPATGSLPGQTPVTGFGGTGLINGFNDGDWPLGTIESPAFTIEQDYINFLVGGGNHPHVPGGQLANEPPAGDLLFEGFEFPDGTNLSDAGWQLAGDFEPARNPSTAGGEYFIGAKRINTFEGGPEGDNNTGTLTSPEFTIDDSNISFLIGGGQRDDGTLQAELVVDGTVVETATGKNSGALEWRNWDVSAYTGQQAALRLVDNASGGWGHLTFDHVVMGSEPALPRSSETTVNLVVDDEVVRSSTGNNSESLDWTNWDVSDLAGQEASIKIIDNNRGGWGHILADEFMFSDTPAHSRLEGYDWLDWGKDYYATVSFSNVPDDKRIMLGWMNNWDYANNIPTSTWRSSMTLPREVSLTQTPDGPRLVQKVVDQIDSVRKDYAAYTDGPREIREGHETLPIAGDLVQIDAEFAPGDAERFGLTVLGDGTEATKVGYDASTERLFVDRTNSGNEDFHPAFSSIDDAPVPMVDGRVSLRMYVDRASVEVFANNGLTTITDQVFPNAGADKIGLFSEGGTAQLEKLTITPLSGTMWDTGSSDGATKAPGKAQLSIDHQQKNGPHDGNFAVNMQLLEGEKGSLFKLYENGKLIRYEALSTATSGAQTFETNINDRPNGKYVYTGELINSKGATKTTQRTVVVGAK